MNVKFSKVALKNRRWVYDNKTPPQKNNGMRKKAQQIWYYM